MKKGNISIEQIVKGVIFIAVLVIVFLGTSYLYGKQITWASWLPEFSKNNPIPEGIYMIRYDTASRNVQSYDGVTWEDFEKDAETEKGFFKLDDKMLTDVDLKLDFEKFYYGEGEKNAPKRFGTNWFYVLGFETIKDIQGKITPYLFKGETGYVVAKEYVKSTNAMPENKGYANRYYLFTAGGGVYYKKPEICCNGAFVEGVAYFTDNKIVVNENVLKGEPKISDMSFIAKDVIGHLGKINGKKVNYNELTGFSSEELNKLGYELIKYGAGIVQLFYFEGDDKNNGEPVDIWFKAGSEKFNIWTVNHKFDVSYIEWTDNSTPNFISDRKKFVEDWKKSILVKPIGINVHNGEKASSDKEIKYYCGKLYDGRYIVVDLGIEVKENDVCGGK